MTHPKAKFTKGPWETVMAQLIPQGGSTNRPIGVKGLGLAHYSGPQTDDEESANARLIAAAPELFDALWAFIDPENEDDAVFCIDEAEYVIRKVLGVADIY